MAGRGRGGSGLSLTQEQLQALGAARGELQTPTIAPPPLFPKLDTKPLPLPNDASMDYMLIVKKQFIDNLSESPAYVKLQDTCEDVERYSDKYKLISQDKSCAKSVTCVWSHVPMELRPGHMKTKISNVKKRKLPKVNDIDSRLQDLEKRERKEPSGDTETKVPAEDEDEVVLEEEDEEMDEGTDYVDNYFDNGEELDDDEDNLDDGPVY